MSKHTEARDVYTCDGCGKRFVMEEGELPGGYHGTAYEINEAGGGAVIDWYACEEVCIRTAVMRAAARGWDNSL